ncbi:MAG: hypothetical protein KDB22_23240 [Planctomycetales bacterium]|nr:hypothetical protein [Planctomycetales bacterium]
MSTLHVPPNDCSSHSALPICTCLGRRFWVATIAWTAVLLSACSQRTSTPGATANKSQVDAETRSLADSPSDQADPVEPTPVDEGAGSLDNHSTANPMEMNARQAKAAAEEAPFDRSGTWTTRRMVALAVDGPKVIDFSVSVGAKSLEEAGESLLSAVVSELLDPETQVSWADLLDNPLVSSGWLGNLLADEEQRDQLISMYDTARDDLVAPEELRPFLTRGLSRSSPLQISDVGASPEARIGSSFWGLLDQDKNGSLSADEAQQIGESLGQYDYNGDSVVSAAELADYRRRQNSEVTMNRSMLLQESTLLIVNEDAATEELAIERDAKSVANKLMQHYSFLPELSRELWPRWSDDRWKLFDTNADGTVNRNELAKGLMTQTADILVWVQLPDPLSDPGKALVHTEFTVPTSATHWLSSRDGGRLQDSALLTAIEFSDTFSRASQIAIRGQLQAALGNIQMQTFIRDRLQLAEHAFDLLDADSDKQLSDEEFRRVWRWLSARQSSRVVVRWMVDADPWFRLLDVDADLRVSASEWEKPAELLTAMDVDNNQRLDSHELPLVIRAEVSRVDSRMTLLPESLESTTAESPPTDWFSAMDSNQDGSIAELEFLGDYDDFARLDLDNDGYITRGEVYESPVDN